MVRRICLCHRPKGWTWEEFSSIRLSPCLPRHLLCHCFLVLFLFSKTWLLRIKLGKSQPHICKASSFPTELLVLPSFVIFLEGWGFVLFCFVIVVAFCLFVCFCSSRQKTHSIVQTGLELVTGGFPPAPQFLNNYSEF